MYNYIFTLVGVCFWMTSPAHATDNTYDPVGRLTHVETADGTTIDYLLDDNGNILNRTVTRPVNLTLLIDPPGAGTVTGEGRYLKATNVALTATPGSAFDFAAWKKADGTVLSTNANYNHSVTGNETLIAHFTPIPPPTITVHPIGGQLTSGSPISLAVTATGRAPLSYSWKRNGQLLSDTSSSLTRSNSTFLDAGTYTAEVTNPGGTTVSQSALITIPISSYTAWQNGIFTQAEISSNNPLLVGHSTVIGADGMNNLLHYAFGATNRNHAPPNSYHVSSYGNPSYPVFEYNRLIGGGGLAYQVATANDLVNWDVTGNLIEQIGVAVPNADGITEKVKIALIEPYRSTWRNAFFKLHVTDNASFQTITLQNITNFNYYDSGDASTPEIKSETPVAGRFETVTNGIRAKPNRWRGGATIITKEQFPLAGKTVEYIWEGNNGNNFMEIVCGSILGNTKWPDGTGTDYFMRICSFNNSWLGSWVASPGVIYKTTVTYTSNTAFLETRYYSNNELISQAHFNGNDYTQPQRLYIRTGDTQDTTNVAHVILKSLRILSTPSYLFNDDFSSDPLNGLYWNQDVGAQTTISNGIFHISSASWSKTINTLGKFAIQRDSFQVEWRMKRNGNYDAALVIGDGTSYIYLLDSSYSGTVPPGFRVSTNGAFGVVDLSDGNPTTNWMEYRATFNGINLKVERGITLDQISQTINTTIGSPIQNHNVHFSIGNGGSNTASFDWIRIR